MTGRVFKASIVVVQSYCGDACGGLRLRQQSKATSKSLEQRIYVNTQDSSFVQCVSPTITYYPDLLSQELANSLYQHCLELEWQQNQIRIAGKTMPVPRLECIYGDAGCDYLYSNSVFLKPLTWTDNLAKLRDRITALTGYKFRIVIGNQYRSGQDSIGWHADNEPSMGSNPAIVSVSLGSCRKFQIKPRNGKPTDFWLEHGSLLVMHPGCQSTHLHQVPKTSKVVSTRINLTFRPHTGGGR